MLHIEIRNHPPIDHAALDLRPLTVITGPNGSGKSRLAAVIHCVHRGLPYTDWAAPWPTTAPDNRPQPGDLEDALKGLAHHATHHPGSPEGIPIRPEDIPQAARTLLEREVHALTQQIRETFMHELEASTQETRQHHQELQVTIRQDHPQVHLTLAGPDGEHPDHIPLVMPTQMAADLAAPIARHPDLMLHRIREEMLQDPFRPAPNWSHLLPADRAAITRHHRLMGAGIIRSSPLRGRNGHGPQGIDADTANLLEDLLTIDPHRKPATPALAELAEFIQDQVIRTDVLLDERTDLPYPNILWSPRHGPEAGRRFHIRQAPGAVAQAAPLVLLLRHTVMPGDLLIIENPETHLEPPATAAMTRALHLMAHAGLRVLATTLSLQVVTDTVNPPQWTGPQGQKPLPEDQRTGYVLNEGQTIQMPGPTPAAP